MLLVPCPNCGPRNQSDLRLLGASVSRPDPNNTTRAEWGAYLYLRDNPADWITESWYCRSGCRQYFKLERHQATNEFRNPPLPGDKLGTGTYTTITVGSSGNQPGTNAGQQLVGSEARAATMSNSADLQRKSGEQR